MNYRNVEGVWCAYGRDNDYNPRVMSVHAGELEARRAAMSSNDYGADVVFLEWDQTLESALSPKPHDLGTER